MNLVDSFILPRLGGYLKDFSLFFPVFFPDAKSIKESGVLVARQTVEQAIVWLNNKVVWSPFLVALCLFAGLYFT